MRCVWNYWPRLYHIVVTGKNICDDIVLKKKSVIFFYATVTNKREIVIIQLQFTANTTVIATIKITMLPVDVYLSDNERNDFSNLPLAYENKSLSGDWINVMNYIFSRWQVYVGGTSFRRSLNWLIRYVTRNGCLVSP